MAQVDAELLERVARWCAEAGRQSGAAEIRRALAPLSWDELLAVRALLADPPPARPLGPLALADLARGAPPDVAAEREREGRYRSEGADEDANVPPAEPSSARPPAARPRAARRSAKRAGPVIRRARDAAPARPVAPPSPPPVDALLRPEGRAVLERLVRRHGARRSALAAALAEGWTRDDGGRPGADDLARLLEHHGLTRAFERRERDELLHALRAAGGVQGAAAARLGLDAGALRAELARLGATGEAESIRERRRADLRARATLTERVRLLLGDEARLRDLDLLAEFEEDLRSRLPEHVRALRTATVPVALALSRSLSIGPAEARALAARLGVALDASAPARARPGAGKRPAGEAPSPRAATEPRSHRAAKPVSRGRPPGGGARATGAASGRNAPRPPRPTAREADHSPRRPRGGGRARPPGRDKR
jgi:hypothetical protein